ncbi:hypothetical protein QQZ08_007729 [Neonectria magnoliae]|uniref:DUF7730 domain-containing protein n=1 Tax=Neonectria magnoliae TaxID=2732573 RepID=A0ABR1HX25_9HYPO
MPNPISNWFRRKYGQIRPRPRVPTLPKNRRPITPEASDAQNEAGKLIPRNGLFFAKLPAEIRYKILVEAFGDQVVHMDLIYEYPRPLPETTEPSPGRDGYFHRGRSMQPKFIDWEHVDRYRLKQWGWRNSVCRRAPLAASSRRRVQAARHRCRIDAGVYRPGKVPSQYFIGIMGWLLSCRQAYIEGIDVLYSRNTIHMASKEMIMNLPRLLVPQRLEAITSVEILWDFEPFPESGRKSDYQPLADCKSFQAFLNLVPTLFPKMVSLYISLQGCLHYKSSEYPSSDEELFGILEPTIMLPVDNMVRKLRAQARKRHGLEDREALAGRPTSAALEAVGRLPVSVGLLGATG